MHVPVIVFQGERGAFSEQAARSYFAGRIELLPAPSFKALFSVLQDRTADYAVVPIENSLAGSVHENYDLLLKFQPSIIGEIYTRISHHLLALPGAPLAQIKKIYSHPQAISQCSDFFDCNPRFEIIPTYDTAGSAKKVAGEKLTTAAAIASEQAAEVYGLEMLARNIENNHENFTRFLITSNTREIAAGANKTSIVFATKDIPGALFKSLAVFALRDINLLKIESRPLHGKPFNYIFYLDFEGNPLEEASKNALQHLEEITHFVQMLGCYPKGKTILS